MMSPGDFMFDVRGSPVHKIRPDEYYAGSIAGRKDGAQV